ncbi:MAG: thiamine pyrophosphate-dependent enzyme [Acidobacteriota bacterium]
MQNLAESPLTTEQYAEQHYPELSYETTFAKALVSHLSQLGIRQSFGIIGGAIGVVYDALEQSQIEVHHYRHETGAAFAAAEAHFATDEPTLVFTTTGPGILNVLTGITAAKWDGAKVLLISGSTSAPQRGRWATQETSSYTLPQDTLYSAGPIFDFAIRVEHPAEFPEVIRRLSLGMSRPGGFVAHISLPISVQSARVELPKPRRSTIIAAPSIAKHDVEACADRLKESPFAVWLGFGARKATPAIRMLVERSGAKVFCSPRAKGIVPEDDPNFVGVTGLGGHESVNQFMVEHRPDWILVMGTRLGEATSFWDPELKPARGFIHVDIDPEVPGVAYPDVETLGIQAEIGAFLEALLPHFPEDGSARQADLFTTGPNIEPTPLDIAGKSPVRPQALMRAIQKHVVQGTDAIVMAECGNSFAWCNHHLCFRTPNRYRVSTLYGSMGHFAAGVVGAAQARRRKAVAVVGDGSMLMNSEISTAAQHGTPAVWIVLNDAAYGMCENGQQVLGLAASQLCFPEVDFVALARSMGADGIRVESEDMLDVAMRQAIEANGPFVVDVRIDPSEASPLMQRFESLLKQGSTNNVAGWEI